MVVVREILGYIEFEASLGYMKSECLILVFKKIFFKLCLCRKLPFALGVASMADILPLLFTGMIDNLLSPNLIDGALTRLVLVNAVYFKGLWKSRFQPESTKKRTFVAGDGKSYQVPMLAQLSVFRSGECSLGEVYSNVLVAGRQGLWHSFLKSRSLYGGKGWETWFTPGMPELQSGVRFLEGFLKPCKNVIY